MSVHITSSHRGDTVSAGIPPPHHSSAQTPVFQTPPRQPGPAVSPQHTSRLLRKISSSFVLKMWLLNLVLNICYLPGQGRVLDI